MFVKTLPHFSLYCQFLKQISLCPTCQFPSQSFAKKSLLRHFITSPWQTQITFAEEESRMLSLVRCCCVSSMCMGRGGGLRSGHCWQVHPDKFKTRDLFFPSLTCRHIASQEDARYTKKHLDAFGKDGKKLIRLPHSLKHTHTHTHTLAYTQFNTQNFTHTRM